MEQKSIKKENERGQRACPICQEMIEETAEVCPFCDEPTFFNLIDNNTHTITIEKISKKNKKYTKRWLTAACLAIIALLGLYLLLQIKREPSLTNEEQLSQIINERFDDYQNNSDYKDIENTELSEDNNDNIMINDSIEVLHDIEETTADVGFENIIFERKLNETDTDNMTKEEMYILRNMIYARHGYKFKNVELQEYFSMFSWYNATTEDASTIYNELSEIEKYNVDFIRNHE